jgi:diguanylate cyclase (GGDEF)-like protein/PAS domain S-box-containing protein
MRDLAHEKSKEVEVRAMSFMKAPIPANEESRQEALEDYEILDSAREESFDALVRLAAEICGTPMGSVTLIDRDRQWFKASVGLENSETKRDISFCAHAITQADIFQVPDATKDARFADNPLVLGDPNIRFYAGVPLETEEGQNLGTVCVIDRVPRQLTETQKDALRVLAKQAMAQMELRRKVKQLKLALLERDRAQEELRGSEERFRDLFDAMQEMVQSVGPEGKLLYANRAWREKLGYAKEEIAGLDVFRIFAEDNREAARGIFQRAIAGELFQNLPLALRTKNGETVQVEADITWKAEGGKPVASRTIFRDITERVAKTKEIEIYQKKLEEANARLGMLAETDQLTGLKNRRAFQERLEEEAKFSKRHKLPLCFLIMDVDHFKEYNDTFGHLEGDRVLARVAEILQQRARETDFVSRFGGEEFAVLLRNTRPEGALVAAELFRKTIASETWELRAVTVSIGIAPLGLGQGSTDEMIRAADEALYQAKREGRNRICLAKGKP